MSLAPYTFRGDSRSRVIATAIHAGHEVRPEVASQLALDDATRQREEDPCTDRIAACAPFHVLVSRSRFEFDLNRPREEAVYQEADQSWGLNVWRSPPSPSLIERSLTIYDRFYADLEAHLDRLAEAGPFVVYDVHAYNHRRGGPGSEAAAQVGNPDVNVGTGSLPRRWQWIVEAFMSQLSGAEVQGRTLDVRENVVFQGRHLAAWVHARYPTQGCVLALEFKKTFMDEWTGNVDGQHLDALVDALQDTIPPLVDGLQGVA